MREDSCSRSGQLQWYVKLGVPATRFDVDIAQFRRETANRRINEEVFDNVPRCTLHLVVDLPGRDIGA